MRWAGSHPTSTRANGRNTTNSNQQPSKHPVHKTRPGQGGRGPGTEDQGAGVREPEVRSPIHPGHQRGDVQSLMILRVHRDLTERTSRADAKMKAELGGHLVESGQVVDMMAFLRDEVIYTPEALPRVAVSTRLDFVVVDAMMTRAASGASCCVRGLSAPRCASGFEASSFRRGSSGSTRPWRALGVPRGQESRSRVHM